MNAVDVKDIRTDVLVEMMHNLYHKMWKIDDDMELIQEELDRRGSIVVG